MKEWGSHREEDEEHRSHRSIYLCFIILAIIVTVFAISLIDPVLLIGGIWDWDIQDQLLKANNNALQGLGNEKESTMVYYRFIYEKNPDTEIRIERAIKVFEDTFDHPDNHFEVKRFENSTLLEFTWKAENGS